MTGWLEAFLLTQLIEMPIYRYLLRCSWPMAFTASLLTHPVVWFVIPKIWHWQSYAAYFIIAESFAVIVEALFLRRFGWRRAFFAALAANGTSATFGLIKNHFFGN